MTASALVMLAALARGSEMVCKDGAASGLGSLRLHQGLAASGGARKAESI